MARSNALPNTTISWPSAKLLQPGFSELRHMNVGNRLRGKSSSIERATAGENDRPSTAGSCGIAIMAKASAPGRTKTRLVPPLTFEQAAALNTAFLRDVVGNLSLAGSYAALARYVAFAPAGAEEFFRGTLPSDIGLIDACLPNLGDCLQHTIEEIFARGHASAVVLNSDSPTLPTALLVETADALARPGERAVLGPHPPMGVIIYLGSRPRTAVCSRKSPGAPSALPRKR
jgi:glycosyltransferase A (GT-A) superfamily protein (DUF2064 family)